MSSIVRDWLPSTVPCLLVLDFAIQWVSWSVAYFYRTEKFYDLTGSSTFVLLVSLCLSWHGGQHPRQAIQAACVVLWGVRLGLFLFVRILGSGGRDRRFDRIRDSPVRFFSAWTLQGVWVMVTLLPSLLCITSDQQPGLGARDYIGWGMWLFGFSIEVVADHQKTSFRSNPDNQGQFISSGLWSLSRHPNYFGEILLWFGLYVSASSTFVSYQYISVLCPTLLYLLITRVSGVPMLESHARKKWGGSPLYQRYVANTPMLVPFWG